MSDPQTEIYLQRTFEQFWIANELTNNCFPNGRLGLLLTCAHRVELAKNLSINLSLLSFLQNQNQRVQCKSSVCQCWLQQIS